MDSCTMWVLITVFMTYFAALSDAAPDVAYTIQEELPRNTIIGDVSVDSDLKDVYSEAEMAQLRYRILEDDSPQQGLFNIEETTGVLTTALKLDRDVICRGREVCIQSISVAVSPAQFFRLLSVDIEITDLNDNSPQFESRAVHLTIPESADINKKLMLPQAQDPDTKRFTINRYTIVAAEDIPFILEETVLQDNSTELKLVLQSNIDREEKGSYHFEIVAEDGGNPPRSGTLDVNVTVLDTNDHVPVFERPAYVIEVGEDEPIGSTIVTVAAYDVDIGLNGEIVYGLATRSHENYGHLFGVRQHSGEVHLKDQLDYETHSSYQLIITATDRGEDAQTSQATVTVNVIDINDFAPVFTVNTLTGNDTAKVAERMPVGTFVSIVSVTDRDSGESGDVTCGLDNGQFQLNFLSSPKHFTVLTNAVFDREEQSQYVVQLACEDHGEPPLSSTYNLVVRVEDVNDHDPQFQKTLYSPQIEENTPEGHIILRVEATDRDLGQNALIEYHLAASNNPEINTTFAIGPRSGAIKTLQPLDYERNQSISFEILAIDGGTPAHTATATIALNVLDINDNPPVFLQSSYSFALAENERDGTSIGNVVARDADSVPFNSVLYSLEPSGEDYQNYDVINKFRIDTQSGYLFSRQELDREEQDTYYLTVVARNTLQTELVGSSSVTIHIIDRNDNAPAFVFPNPSNFTVSVRNDADINQVVARIRARDADLGNNSNVLYHQVDADNELFHVDVMTGAVTVNGDLTDLVDAEFNLTVKAEDNGVPKRSKSAVLVLVVTDALHPGDSGSNNGQSGQQDQSSGSLPNIGIVIGVACGSTVVIVILVLAIIIIACKGRQSHTSRKGHAAQHHGQYNCRQTEAQRMLSHSGKADNRSLSDCSGSQCNSPVKTAPVQAVSPRDVNIMGGHIRSPSPGGAGQPQVSASDNKVTYLTDGNLPIATTSTFNARALSPGGTPLKTCDTYVQSKSQAGGAEKFSTTLVPLTDKEIEIHKVLKFLHTQQDDAESGCSETMSTSDSGRGNSVSEDTLDTGHVTNRASSNTSGAALTAHPANGSTGYKTNPVKAGAASAGANGGVGQPPKQVHFKPLPATLQYQPHSHRQPVMTSSLERDYKRYNGASSPAFHSASAANALSSQLKAPRSQFSTFSSPNAKTANKLAVGANQNGVRRQPARVSFQCPPYDTLPASPKNTPSKTLLQHAPKASALKQQDVNSLPMSKIDECVSSTENLSDDSASTMSGSYVLQQDDQYSGRAATPTVLSPSVCKTLPTIQDSIV